LKLSPILSPSGEPVFTAGGEDAWKVAEHRGYVISLEWVRRGRKHLKCMVIWPATNLLVVGSKTPGQWCITFDAITQFVGFTKDGRCTGSASTFCYEQCLEALPILGKDRNDKAAFLALVDAIVKFAPEMVRQPVAPKAVRRKLAGTAMWEIEAKNKNTGKTFAEAAV